ncbi:MAG: putative addiction module antidote protein [Aestuariivita sp.]|nr:putative addiction module antidote protein [Aestuariivita sp.]MCY4346129.1 putative addiction module antidote protein [Aestuariivita sp.]
MNKTFTKWDPAEHLKTPVDARLHLEACAAEDPGDGNLIRAALNDIARSRNMSRLAHEAGMTREGLYKALSENGNPSFATVMRITRALGMHLRITAQNRVLDDSAMLPGEAS